MSLPLPELDDINFDQLMEDARALIPRVAPEWTDHNAHDPGMTLLELLAWLVDQDLYQLGFISDQHIRAFAALLGASATAPTPAKGLIWPANNALSEDPRRAGVELESGLVITAKEQPDTPFQLAANIHITPARIVSVETAQQHNANHTAHNVQWLSAIELTGPIKEEGASVSLRENSATLGDGMILVNLDRPLVEVGASSALTSPVALGVEISPQLSAVPASECPTNQSPGNLLVEYRLQKPGQPWRLVSIISDSTQAFDQSGLVMLDIPAAPFDPKDKCLAQLRIGIRGKTHRITPKLKQLSLNVLPVEQLTTVSAQALSPLSNGLPNQVYTLPVHGLVSDLILETGDQGSLTTWSAIDTLNADHNLRRNLRHSGPNDRVFILDRETNQLIFGNGLNGAIPPREAQIRHRDYSITQGAAGNLTTGLSWFVPGAPMQNEGAFGSNLFPLTGGKDESSIDDLTAQARHNALTRQVALANEQLVAAALNLDYLGIARAEVLANYYPNLNSRAVPGVRALVVTPQRVPLSDPFAPVPQALLQTVKTELAERRVLGERLLVLASRPVAVTVKAELLIAEGMSSQEVVAAAIARLNARLSDIGVSDKNAAHGDIAPWPLGRPVTPEEIKSLLAGVAGVIAVPHCLLARDGQAFQHDNLRLAAEEIAIGQDHQLTTTQESLRLSMGQAMGQAMAQAPGAYNSTGRVFS